MAQNTMAATDLPTVPSMHEAKRSDDGEGEIIIFDGMNEKAWVQGNTVDPTELKR